MPQQDFDDPSTKRLNEERKMMRCLSGLSEVCLDTFKTDRCHRICGRCYKIINRKGSDAYDLKKGEQTWEMEKRRNKSGESNRYEENWPITSSESLTPEEGALEDMANELPAADI